MLLTIGEEFNIFFLIMAVILCIWDGWGVSSCMNKSINPIVCANTPNYDKAIATRPVSYLQASGVAVGVRDDQMGNSEVGHLTIGAGRRMQQQLKMIDEAIANDEIEKTQEFQDLIRHHDENGDARCNLIGLASDGGIHSHIDHIEHVIRKLVKHRIPINMHVITDGRDSAPQTAMQYIKRLKEAAGNGNMQISTISGRFYAMDRDDRWDRTKLACDVVIDGISLEKFAYYAEVFDKFYADGIYDEFILPVQSYGYRGINKEDSVFMLNFRSDRLRQIMERISKADASCFFSLFDYETRSDNVRCLLKKDVVKESIGSVIADSGKKQLRLAETEKYSHVTFFINGGRSDPHDGEERMMFPSPNVLKYDVTPEMAADKITDELVNRIEQNDVDLIIVNYANADMIGHTGNFAAAVKAVEKLDETLGRVVAALEKFGGEMLLTADHGNIEEMVDSSGGMKTSHTVNPVPLIYFGNRDLHLKREGELGNIANTLFELMGIDVKESMMNSLIESVSR